MSWSQRVKNTASTDAGVVSIVTEPAKWPSSQRRAGASAHGHAPREHGSICHSCLPPLCPGAVSILKPRVDNLGTRDHSSVPGSVLRAKGTSSVLLAASSPVLCFAEPAHKGPTAVWQSLSSPQETSHFAYSEWSDQQTHVMNRNASKCHFPGLQSRQALCE